MYYPFIYFITNGFSLKNVRCLGRVLAIYCVCFVVFYLLVGWFCLSVCSLILFCSASFPFFSFVWTETKTFTNYWITFFRFAGFWWVTRACNQRPSPKCGHVGTNCSIFCISYSVVAFLSRNRNISDLLSKVARIELILPLCALRWAHKTRVISATNQM